MHHYRVPHYAVMHGYVLPPVGIKYFIDITIESYLFYVGIKYFIEVTKDVLLIRDRGLHCPRSGT